ncbi:MAG TPA: hypothetical protein VKR59_13150 [Terriglobales bacterium]|nr:hypothetical protein [Terriglobales bacterium]
MAKKKPVPLDWLDSPKIELPKVVDAPTDWLGAPDIVVGQDETLIGIEEKPGSENSQRRSQASKREQNREQRDQQQVSVTIPTSVTPRIWQGKTVDLAEKIIDDHRTELAAGTLTTHGLFHREAVRWQKPDGEPFSAASLRQSHRRREERARGRIVS